MEVAQNVVLTAGTVKNFEKYTFYITRLYDATKPFLTAKTIIFGGATNFELEFVNGIELAVGTEIILLQTTDVITDVDFDSITIVDSAGFKWEKILSEDKKTITAEATAVDDRSPDEKEKDSITEPTVTETFQAKGTVIDPRAMVSEKLDAATIAALPSVPSNMVDSGVIAFVYTPTITTAILTGGEKIAFTTTFISNGTNINDFRFEKLKDDDSVEPFILIDDSVEGEGKYTEGNFWIVDPATPTTIIPKGTALTAEKRYTVYFVIENGSNKYDTNNDPTSISDPARITQPSSTGSSGSGGGCTVGATANYDFMIFLLALMGMVGLRSIAARKKG